MTASSRVGSAATVRDVLWSRLDSAPRTTAVVTGDGVALTRGELLRELQHRARRIDDVADGGGFVEVLGGGGLETALSCLAVTLSGRAYAVVAPQWPEVFRERVRSRLRPVASVVAAPDYHVVAPTPWSRRVPDDRLAVGMGEPGEQPACVFFTSGTTGEPKGVVIPHRALLRTCDAPVFLRTRRSLRMPQLAPLTWDAGALELWAPLLSGGACLVPSVGMDALDSVRWAVCEGRATAMWLTASLGNLVIDAEPRVLAGLELLLMGGERLSEPHIARLARAAPSLRIINGYGPVESTVFATTHEIDPAVDLGGTGIPLGQPIAATEVVILDDAGCEVPTGTPGEIVVRGDGVALGYLGVDPDDDGACGGFRPVGDGSGLEYCTGDIGAIRADGLLEYHGRRDAEVKVSGVRVDIAGLERRITGVHGVRQAVVVRRLDSDDNVLALAARVVPQPTAAHEVLAAIDDELADLPAASRPAGVEVVESLPRTASGKVDRAAVERELRLIRAEPPPGIGQVDIVAEAIHATLGSVDAARSLSDLGTTSLLAMRLASALRAATGRDVPVAGLYRLDRLDDISAWLSARPVAQATPQRANVMADIAARYWTSEALAPRSEAHLVFCRFRGPSSISGATNVECAIRAAAGRYLLGLRGVTARFDGVVRSMPVEAEVTVLVDTVPWADDVARARDLASSARGLHDLEHGPMMAFVATEVGDEVEVLGVFHHILVDGESLRTVGLLLQEQLRTPGDAAPVLLGPVLRRTVEWSPADVEFWRAALHRLPRLELEGTAYRSLAEVWGSGAHEHRREIASNVRARVAAVRDLERAPELAAWLHLAVSALRSALGIGAICVGTMVRPGPDTVHPRGCVAQPIPIVIGADDTTMGAIATTVLAALDHASVPYSDILAVAGVDDPFGPYRIVVNLQDERSRDEDGNVWLPRSLAPSAPVVEFYVEFVLRDDEPTCVRVVTPDAAPYRELGARIADRIAEGKEL